MIANPTLTTAFLVGLFGSVHCIGMCGGIVGALTMGLPAAVRSTWTGMFPYLVLYNGGRIISYMVAGTLAGLLSAQMARLGWQANYPLGTMIAGFFMVALGVYIAGWSQALLVFERWGGRLWKRIEPFGRRFLPIDNPWQAFGLGLIWGWLPCGMVYAALAWSLTSADPVRGGALMLAFGLGTLPMLLAMGSAARGLTWVAQQSPIRQLAGVIIIGFGIYTLSAAVLTGSPVHHH